jgi:FSR family fosmidomycin resistance protein-like MFS transporter
VAEVILPRDRSPAAEVKLIANISAAHFVSHYYFMLLPPLFEFIRADFGVSYTGLGLALTAFNIVSAVFQTPAGFAVDRFGALRILIAGIALEAVAFALCGVTTSYWLFLALFGVAGFANTVFHPADYAILSQRIAPARASHAFSIHTFSGILGTAVAPASLLLLYNYVGWRGAFIASGILGLAVVVLLVLYGQSGPSQAHARAASPPNQTSGRDVLLSPAILRNLAFFALIALANVGLGNYSVVALTAAHGTTAAVGNTALTVFLFLSAFGVLAGGWLATRVTNHIAVAAIGQGVTGVSAVLVGLYDLNLAALILVMGLGGFTSGLISPSRDMIVRSVTPPDAYGRVFGFVTTGFNITGTVAPIIYGALMDYGEPRMIFYVAGAACILSIATVLTNERSKAA